MLIRKSVFVLVQLAQARKPARSAQDVLNELDERYMHEDFDPVKELFNNLPEDGEDVSAMVLSVL